MVRVGRTILVGVCVAAGLARLGVGRVEAADHTAIAAGQANLPSTATLQVTSREKVVDVTVSDAKGNPVHGLMKAEFTVEQDGTPQTIRSFKEYGAGLQAPTPVRPRLPANVYSNVQETPASGPVNVILLDDFATPPDTMANGKKKVAKYLREMPQGTQVAVYAVSHNKGLRLLQDFTTDGAVAAASVEALDVEWFRNRASIDPHEAMRMIAAHAAGIRGRKNLLWFASQFPINACTPGITDQQVRDFFRPLTEEQFAVYSVDAAGLEIPVPKSNYIPCKQRGMEMIAEATGGKALYNSNDFESMMAKAVENGSNYFTLTYVPPPLAYDSQLHAIDVKVDRADLKLVYRKGFNADAPAQNAAASGAKLMQASMERGLPPSTQILFDVRVQRSTEPQKPTDPAVMGILDGKFKKAALTRYGFLYTVPGSEITFSDGPNGTQKGWVEFDVMAFDAEGRQLTMLSQNEQIPMTEEKYAQFEKTPFQFIQQIDLPAGALTLRVGVLDGVSNRVGTVEIPLTVSKGPGLMARR
jgi:VWFA-related protein